MVQPTTVSSGRPSVRAILLLDMRCKTDILRISASGSSNSRTNREMVPTVAVSREGNSSEDHTAHFSEALKELLQLDLAASGELGGGGMTAEVLARLCKKILISGEGGGFLPAVASAGDLAIGSRATQMHKLGALVGGETGTDCLLKDVARLLHRPLGLDGGGLSDLGDAAQFLAIGGQAGLAIGVASGGFGWLGGGFRLFDGWHSSQRIRVRLVCKEVRRGGWVRKGGKASLSISKSKNERA